MSKWEWTWTLFCVVGVLAQDALVACIWAQSGKFPEMGIGEILIMGLAGHYLLIKFGVECVTALRFRLRHFKY